MSAFDPAALTLLLSAVSFFAGFIDSIAGGGGLLLLPALLFAGIPPQWVLGTNKLAGTVGTAMALVNFIRSKKIIWRVVSFGIFFSLIGSLIGSKTALYFSNEMLGKIMLFLLPLAMLATLAPKKVSSIDKEELSARAFYFKIPLICFVLGFYDGFFGPGTGSFLIMAFYLWIGLDLVEASATAKVFNLTSCLSALVVFMLEQKVLFALGIPLAIANLAGNYVGSTLAIRNGSPLVKTCLIISLVILFSSLLMKYFIT
jgi:uncharacterized protein